MREIGDHVDGRGGNGDGSAEPTSSAPTHHWLYPMLAGGPGHFEGSDRRYRADFEVYRRAAMAGRILRGEGPLAAGFRSIREHDVLWLFAGGEAGVVGACHGPRGLRAARAEGPLHARPCDVSDPGPGPGPGCARPSVPPPGSARSGLARRARGPHRGARVVGRPARRPRPAASRPTRCPDASTGSSRGARRCSTTRASPGSCARCASFDFAIGVRTEGNASYLVGLGERRLVVGCLVRGGQDAQPTPAVLRTIAAVGWRAWSLKEQLGAATLEPNEWFAFSRAPHPQLVRFLEDGDRSVSWFQGGQMELGPRTRLRWLAPTPVARPRRRSRRRW